MIKTGEKNVADISIEEVNDVEKFRSLREPWDALLQDSHDNNIFLTWEWSFTWWQHHGRDRKLRILLMKKSNEIIGIAPLMQSRYRRGIFGVDVVENISSTNCDYSGIILKEKEPESVTVLLDYLRNIIERENVIIRMSHVPESSNFLDLLRKQSSSFSSSISLYERRMSSCPYFDLPSTWEGFFNSLNKKRRQNIRRAFKALQHDNRVTEFKRFTNDTNLQEQLQVLFELHQKRWRGSSVSKIFTKPATQKFYFDVSEAFNKRGWLNLSFIYIDGQPASAGWGFNYNNEFCYMTCAFDPIYSAYSIGNIHLVRLIEDAIQHKRRKFDLLQGSEDYKLRWTDSKTVNYQVILFRKNLKGKYRYLLLQTLVKLDNIASRSLRENFHQLMVRVQRRRESINN
jgi:CelD/BcsL family acetyltransferase involved in cellulose biosynthesis